MHRMTLGVDVIAGGDGEKPRIRVADQGATFTLLLPMNAAEVAR